MPESRRPNVPNPDQTHVRAPHERDYEREERFQKNPQGKTTTPSSNSPKRPPPRSAPAPRRGR